MQIDVRLIKPLKKKIVSYRAALLRHTGPHMLLHARWDYTLVDTGYLTFAPGDNLYEHFYSDRWYNVYEVRSATGELKGWYCNITRPAIFGDGSVESEDLELDVFVSPDRSRIMVLDEDEYAARDLATSDPPAHQAALAALTELRALAEAGAEPFDSSR